MAVPPCPDNCPDGVPYLDWLSFSQLYQEYLTYCALATAAGNYPGPGPFQPLGVYTQTTDSTFVVPADASLVYWDVPGQSGQADIDFSLVQAGQEVTIVVIDSNGFNVTDVGATVFSLNDTSHRIQGIKSNGDGTITRITGTAAQYDIGTSGDTVALNSANITRSGSLTQSAYILSTATFKPGAGVTGTYLTEPAGGGGLVLVRSLNPADWKIFDVIINTSSGALEWRLVNDAYSAANPYFVISRNGITVTSSQITKPKLGMTGTVLDSVVTGVATMAAGTVTVADAGVTAGSVILVTPGFAAAGRLNYQNIVPGVSFDIVSSDGGDGGSVSYQRTAL